MRIAMVSEHADPAAALGGTDAGGQNVHVAALASQLVARGHSVTVYTRLADADARPTAELAPGLTVRRLRAGPAGPLPKDALLPHMPELGERLAAEWKRHSPDVVHAHFWMSGLAALRGLDGLDVPLVQTFHALGVVKARHQGSKDTSPAGRIDAERRIGLDCDEIVATCTDEVRELTGLAIPAWKISVIPCGVDTALFRPSSPGTPRSARPRLLTLGRLVERKGVGTAIAALAMLPDAELIVAGGPERTELGSNPEFRRLRELALSHGVADRVVFTGGVPRQDVPALIRSADVVLCVPWYEPFGIVPLEAMASGVPVVASAVGGLTDHVIDGTTGLLVPPRDPAAVAEAVITLLGDPARRDAFSAAGLHRARRWYSWAGIAARTEAVYLRLACGAHPDATGRSLTVGAQ